MNNKIVALAGLIGIGFGVLISGTIGLVFFPEDDLEEEVERITDSESLLTVTEDNFGTYYSLDNSIYKPITGDTVYDMLDDNESFILYIGRDTCPYCQQLVPELQASALEFGYTEIYHVDILDVANSSFISSQQIGSVPLVYFFINGEAVDGFLGYQSKEAIDTVLDNLN